MDTLLVSTGKGGKHQPSQEFDNINDALDAASEIYFDGHPNGDDPKNPHAIQDWSMEDREPYHLVVYITHNDEFISSRSVYKFHN